MKRYLVPLIIGVVLILFTGIVYYFVIQLPAKHVAEINLENAKLISQDNQKKQETETKLNECLDDAKKKFQDLFTLNSYPSAQKDYPDARRWNDGDIKLQTEKKYNDDREFCLKLYK